MHSLPIFVRLLDRPVALIGSGEAADAKRRLLERAGARIVGEEAAIALAIVADGDEQAVARLKARGVLVNVVDRPDLCDFTLPAIVDRDPVLVAIGTGGASAGLAAALRQRLEVLLPTTLGQFADALYAARGLIREEFPDPQQRRRALGSAFAPGGDLDPFGPDPDVHFWLGADELRDSPTCQFAHVRLTSTDPDDLRLRDARLLSQADRIYHSPEVPSPILDRARADAERIPGAPPSDLPPGLTIVLEMA